MVRRRGGARKRKLWEQYNSGAGRGKMKRREREKEKERRWDGENRDVWDIGYLMDQIVVLYLFVYVPPITLGQWLKITDCEGYDGLPMKISVLKTAVFIRAWWRSRSLYIPSFRWCLRWDDLSFVIFALKKPMVARCWRSVSFEHVPETPVGRDCNLPANLGYINPRVLLIFLDAATSSFQKKKKLPNQLLNTTLAIMSLANKLSIEDVQLEGKRVLIR